MRDPFFNPRNLLPRAATIKELDALYDYAETAFEVSRSDAQGIVDCFTISVFDEGQYLLPACSGKVMVVLAGGKPNEVYLLTWNDNRLTLARKYVEA